MADALTWQGAALATTLSPTLTGTPTAPTATAGDSSATLATTAFVQGQGFITSTGAPVQSVAGRTGAVTLGVADIAGAAPLASPALTGTPTAPTAGAGTNSTQLATTAFVLANAGSGAVSSVAGRTGAVTLAVADISGALAASTAASTYLALSGGSLTAALLANSAGAGNVARLAGASSTNPVLIGVDSSSADTNVNVTLGNPKGSGYISAQSADSTSTGGNARGTSAVDWQSMRAAASQVASGDGAVIVGGKNNTASAQFSAILGGTDNVADGLGSTARGRYASTRGRPGVHVFGNNRFNSVSGTAQVAYFHMAASSSGATPVQLTTDGNAAGAGNIANPPDNSSGFYFYYAVARQRGGTAGAVGDSAYWQGQQVWRRLSGASTMSLVFGSNAAAAPFTTAGTTGNASTWRIAITADTTIGGYNFTFTGAANTVVDISLLLFGPEALS